MSEARDTQLYILFWRLMDGSIGQEELETVRSLLADDPQTRQRYIEFMLLCANLRRYIGACDAQEQSPDSRSVTMALGDVIEQDEQVRAREGRSLAQTRREEIRRAAETAFERFKEQERRRQEELAMRRYLARRRQLAVGAFAAVLLVVVAVTVWIGRRPARPVAAPVARTLEPPAPPPVVAVVSRASGARWDRRDLEPRAGADLTAGPMTLEKGFLEVAFDGDARLIIEAPAALSLVDKRRVRLERGTLTAHVPTEARGFEVDTPSARVTDLGTDFALTVDVGGAVDVHVLDGWVAASFGNGDNDAERLVKALHQDDAMRFDARRRIMRNIAVNGSRFARSWDDVLYRPRLDGAMRFDRTIPASLSGDALEDDECIRVLLEQTDVLPGSDTAVNIATPGRYDSFEDLSEMVPAGVRIDSYLLHWDPASIAGTRRIITGSVSFRRPILGVLTSVDLLTQTDAAFGLPDTEYPANSVARRLESMSDRQNADVVVLSSDRLTLDVRLRAGSMDQLRVLVTAPSVQER